VDGLVDALTQVPEPDGYGRLFVDEGPRMTTLLHEVSRHDAAAEQARRILGMRSTSAARTVATLSDRELQVLRLLDSELSGPEIARRLFVSPNTLRTHTKHIFTKLDVTNRRAAVRQARERGLM
jgi:LuxR family maltose regulon positive regulatory protein